MRRFSSRALPLFVLLAACGYDPRLHFTGDEAGVGTGGTTAVDLGGLGGTDAAPANGGASGTGGQAGFDARGAGDSSVPPGDVLGGDMPIAVGGSGGSGGIAATGGATGSGGILGTGGTSDTDGPIIKNDAGSRDGGDASFNDLPLPVGCLAPTDPVDGRVVTSSLDVGGVATYTCATGYGPPTPAARTCQADHTWTGADATCPLVDCHTPPPIDHGSPSAPVTTYGATASYTCSPNYVLSGASQRTCQADGTWSGAAPTCTVVTAKVTIDKPVSTAGTVTSSPEGISCGSTCQASFPVGTSLTLTATPGSAETFVGWDSTVCTGKSACSFSLASDVIVKAIFSQSPNIVFVTSTAHSASLGGLAGADNLCMTRAQAAGLPGTYRAWLSTATVGAKDRLGNASGWIRPDGKPVLNRVEDIASNRLLYPPRLDELGNDVGAVNVRTGTGPYGKQLDEPNLTTCGDFTSAVDDGKAIHMGRSSANSWLFTYWSAIGCSSEERLYCFGIDRTAFVSPDGATTGRRAFTTSPFWHPGLGVASADALCQSDATTAGLPGTYKALLATNGASAASRFSATGAPWVRADGIPLTALASGFFSASLLNVSPNITATGAEYFANQSLWSGARTMTTPGTSDTTCGNWLSSTDTTQHESQGQAGDSDTSMFFGGVGGDCTVSARLVCLQE